MSPEKSPYKALEKFSKAVYGTTGGTCSARDFRPLMTLPVLKSSFLSVLFCFVVGITGGSKSSPEANLSSGRCKIDTREGNHCH